MAAVGRHIPAAYFISGHGNEGDFKKITLPPGCTVIVRSKPGQLSISEASAAAAKKIFCAKANIYRDPLRNLPQLIDELGSLAVYTAGESCPNFKFKLLLAHYTSKKRGEVQKIKIAPVSGLIPIPTSPAKQAALCAAFSKPYSNVLPSVAAEDILPETYVHSVMPTPAEVEEIIAEYDSDEEEEEEGDPVSLKDIEDDEESSFYVHLSDLLQLNADGTAGRPGVFYNFACRGAGETDLYTIKKTNAGIIMIPAHGPTIPNVRRAAPGRAGDKTRAVARALRNTIAEAETKRKHLIRTSRRFNPLPRSGSRSRGGGSALRRQTRRRRQQEQ